MRKPQQCRPPHNDLSRSLIPLNLNHTLIAVIELSQKSWLVAGIIPGVEHQPLKKLEPGEDALSTLLDRWRKEANKAGYKVERIAVAFEAGRDGFWLARWLRAQGIEAHVIHAASVAVSRERRRAKTDRLDTEQLKRAFLGWLRGERDHCKMAAIPTFAEEDAKRPSRERESLVGEQCRIVNPIQGHLGAARHSQLQPEAQERRREPGRPAHGGGRADPAQHADGAASRLGAPTPRHRTDTANRGRPSRASQAGAEG